MLKILIHPARFTFQQSREFLAQAAEERRAHGLPRKHRRFPLLIPVEFTTEHKAIAWGVRLVIVNNDKCPCTGTMPVQGFILTATPEVVALDLTGAAYIHSGLNMRHAGPELEREVMKRFEPLKNDVRKLGLRTLADKLDRNFLSAYLT